jgi:hypothetical protein
MADPVNWSKLRKQAIDLVALDLPSNWAALKNVLVVLTGALIFFGCALAAILKTHTVYTVPGLLPDPAPPHPVHIVSKDSVPPAPMTKPASPADVRVDAHPSPNRQPTEPVSLTSSDARMAEARRVEEILEQATRRVSSGAVIGARDMLAAAEDGASRDVRSCRDL